MVDPCKHGVRAFPVWDVCFAYFTCEVDGYGKANGVKWHDCGDGNRFDAGQGRCVSDPTCKSGKHQLSFTDLHTSQSSIL